MTHSLKLQISFIKIFLKFYFTIKERVLDNASFQILKFCLGCLGKKLLDLFYLH